ncbi:hypothetical protein ACQPX6_28485 [Actinomycetospora sp. CA-101289]|uniref:hypothetical protein n=1 Tax=Actinomycetospora sp. CA-101289 TaxID=3239893 RepID=UPI003D9623E5
MSQRWNGDWTVLPGGAVFDRDKQQVAAVSRAEGNLDLFVVGFDNRVWTQYWTDAGGWNTDWTVLPGGAVFDRDKQQVAAVSRAEGNLDLFVVGFDNRVWTQYWTDAGGWNTDWTVLPGGAVFDRDKQQVAAVSRAEGNLDLFVVGFDNRVWTQYWTDAGGWNTDWTVLPGGAVFDRDKQQVAAVSRAEGNLDLFVVGFDNRVWTQYWTDAGGWNTDWTVLPGGAVFDRDKQQVAAVSRAEGNLDLFVVGFDNRVWTQYWTDAGGWNTDWTVLPGGAVFDRDKQQVAAVSRAEGNLDLFVVGFDNHIWTQYWGQHRADRPWSIILCRFQGEAPDATREAPVANFFREAFTPGAGGLVEYWRDVSLGSIDVTGSRVIDWVEIDIPRIKAGGIGRTALIDAAIRAVRLGGDDPLSGFHSQMAVYPHNWAKDGHPRAPTGGIRNGRHTGSTVVPTHGERSASPHLSTGTSRLTRWATASG